MHPAQQAKVLVEGLKALLRPRGRAFLWLIVAKFPRPACESLAPLSTSGLVPLSHHPTRPRELVLQPEHRREAKGQRHL
jgi:hypothetical protein